MNLIELENERLQWSLKIFTEATPLSSLLKAEEEIKEIKENIEKGIKDAEEYADVIMAVFDSAGRDGITPEEIVWAYYCKLKKNKARKWKKNSDNTYSHIKD